MADKFDKATRSRIMASIRSKNTSPERVVFSYLRRRKLYFQKHYDKVAGSPDVALPKKKKAVFIDGEFWHGYTLERRKDKLPMYWIEKIIRNVKSDKVLRNQLRGHGWQVMRVWEHELSSKNRDVTLAKIYSFLTD